MAKNVRILRINSRVGPGREPRDWWPLAVATDYPIGFPSHSANRLIGSYDILKTFRRTNSRAAWAARSLMRRLSCPN